MIQSTDIVKSLPADKFSALIKGDKNSLLREATFAIQIIAGSPKLQECSKESIIKSIWNLASTGLTLNPMQSLAYLTPRWNSATRCNECLLMPSYRGLQKLAQEGGHVRTVQAYLVNEGDEFEYSLGLNPDIKHKPKGGNKITHAYAFAKLQTGEVQFEVMTIEELYAIRDKSDGYKAFADGKAKSAIWADHEGEMCRKTVLKRLLKYLPKIDTPYLQTAMQLDNVEYKATDGQKALIESLAMTSVFDHDHQQAIINGVDDLNAEQASELIQQLKDNQQDIRQTGRPTKTGLDKELIKLESE